MTGVSGAETTTKGTMSEHVDAVIGQVVGKIACLQDLLKALYQLKQEEEKTGAPGVPRGTAPAVPATAKPAPVTRTGQPVTEMVLAAAQRLSKGKTDVVFAHRTLVDVASEMYPDNYTKINRGVYSAVATLKGKGIFRLAPGGFVLGADRQAEWEKLKTEMGLDQPKDTGNKD